MYVRRHVPRARAAGLLSCAPGGAPQGRPSLLFFTLCVICEICGRSVVPCRFAVTLDLGPFGCAQGMLWTVSDAGSEDLPKNALRIARKPPSFAKNRPSFAKFRIKGMNPQPPSPEASVFAEGYAGCYGEPGMNADEHR